MSAGGGDEEEGGGAEETGGQTEERQRQTRREEPKAGGGYAETVLRCEEALGWYWVGTIQTELRLVSLVGFRSEVELLENVHLTERETLHRLEIHRLKVTVTLQYCGSALVLVLVLIAVCLSYRGHWKESS